MKEADSALGAEAMVAVDWEMAVVEMKAADSTLGVVAMVVADSALGAVAMVVAGSDSAASVTEEVRMMQAAKRWHTTSWSPVSQQHRIRLELVSTSIPTKSFPSLSSASRCSKRPSRRTRTRRPCTLRWTPLDGCSAP